MSAPVSAQTSNVFLPTAGIDNPESSGEVGDMPSVQESAKNSRFESLQSSAVSMMSIIYDYVILLHTRDYYSSLIAKMIGAARDPCYTESDFSEKWQLYSGELTQAWKRLNMLCSWVIFSIVIFLSIPATYPIGKPFAAISALCGFYGLLVGNIYVFLLRRVPNGRVWNIDKMESSGFFNASNLVAVPLASYCWCLLFWFVMAAATLATGLEDLQSEFGQSLPAVISIWIFLLLGGILTFFKILMSATTSVEPYSMLTVGLDDPKSPGVAGETLPAHEEAEKKISFRRVFAILSCLSDVKDI
ncbi:hypothetical protein A0H81_11101 [Grifola frondosa]|uniref:Uncharacterized protein n=1 Tax=Grifola frondosa TaxID=5627 RepID=A0A1C7LW70_GRIFR|nr:hypothetical protein A0H81_11101 [Grifola frondosa]